MVFYTRLTLVCVFGSHVIFKSFIFTFLFIFTSALIIYTIYLSSRVISTQFTDVHTITFFFFFTKDSFLFVLFLHD